jgi:hypothetical protein
MRKVTALFIALFVYFGVLFAPAMGASLLSKPGRAASSTSTVAGKKSQKKTCKKLKKKIKKAKTKKAKKRAKKKYNKKCKCKKLKKKIKKAKSAKKRKRAKKKYNKKCKSGGSGGGGSGGGGSGGGGSGGGGSGGGGSGGGGSGTKTERTAEGTYGSPVVGVAGIGYVCGMGCVTFPVGTDEAYVSIEIVDDSGQPAGAAIAQDTNGDGVGDIFATVCGKTAAPIAITPGLELSVAVGAGVVVGVDTTPPSGCPSVATTGTVKVTFSNLP